MRIVRSRAGGGAGVLADPDATGARLEEPGERDLDAVMTAHAEAVLRLAISYVRDRGLAEDIVQETFLRWVRHRDQVDPARTRGWLLSVAANLGRDQLRSWSHRHLSWTDAVPETGSGAGPDDAAVAVDDARRLATAVMALPVPFREVVHLRYYEQLDTNEIAHLLSIPPATVRTRLLRARRDLRRVLWKEDQGA